MHILISPFNTYDIETELLRTVNVCTYIFCLQFESTALEVLKVFISKNQCHPNCY